MHSDADMDMRSDNNPMDTLEFSLEDLQGTAAETGLPAANHSALREILHSLGTAPNFRDSMRACALSLHQWTQVDAATIYRISPNGEELDQIHSIGFSNLMASMTRRISVEGTFTGHAVRQRKIITATNVDTDERIPEYFRQEMQREGMKTLVSLPLLMHSEVVGAISMGWRRPMKLRELDSDLLMHMGYGVAIAVEHDLRDFESSSDSLTGLLNRRSFDDALQENRNICLKSSTPLALAMLDLDDFKACNDIHGHHLGDDILKASARQMRTLLQHEQHLAYRVGGEEFALLLPDVGTEQAYDIVNKIAESIGQLEFQGRDGESLHITLSAGITLYDSNTAESAAQFYDRADQAMYAAKNNGKDQIVVFESTPDNT
ncbi:MAG: diguanylate cyclase domain-containing protein [Oceanococcus sp.]